MSRTAPFDLDGAEGEGRRPGPAMDGLDLAPEVTLGPDASHWDETPWRLGEGYGQQAAEPSTTSSPSTTA